MFVLGGYLLACSSILRMFFFRDRDGGGGGGKPYFWNSFVFISHDSYLLLSLSHMQHGGMLMFFVLLQILPSNYCWCWRGSNVGYCSQTGSHKASEMDYSCSVKPHEAMKQVVPSGRGWCCGHVVFWEKCQELSMSLWSRNVWVPSGSCLGYFWLQDLPKYKWGEMLLPPLCIWNTIAGLFGGLELHGFPDTVVWTRGFSASEGSEPA